MISKMIQKYIWFFLLFTLTALSISTTSAPREKFVIIVNKENEISSISRKELSKIFLKRVRRWDNDEKITPVDQKVEIPVREFFTLRVHKKKVAAIKAYWQKRIFTGRGVPPAELKSSKEVLEYVSEDVNAIGYIRSNSDISNHTVKILTVDYE